MANGMTTGTIGTTAEKDKTRSGVLLVRIQYLETCKKKQKKTKNNNNNKTKRNTNALFNTTILHAENQYYTAY